MRPTLSQCFPNPLTRQWPSTTNPVSCECQQLYALVCICCCVPRGHLLVTHEGGSNNMVTSMPRGPRYVDFKIIARTSAEDLAGFLYRAELAMSGGGGGAVQQQQQQQQHSPSVSGGGDGSSSGPAAGWDSLLSPASSRNAEVLSPHNHHRQQQQQRQRQVSSGGGRPATVVTRQVVVVCLHGIAVASPSVRSVLMDALCFGQVPTNGTVRAVPSLRVVAFCDFRACVAVLPEPLRAAFPLSTFMSGLAMDSAVVLQCADPRASNVVNKANMLEVMGRSDGADLLDTVTLSSAVARYLRHLIMTVQGSTTLEMVPGILLIRHIADMYRICKAAAILFMPNDDLFARRLNPRAAAAGALRTSSWGDGGRLISRHHRHTNNTHGHKYAHGAGTAADGIFAPVKDAAGRVFSFKHIVVSPADAISLVPAIVTHCLSLRRAVIDVESRQAACRQAMSGLSAPLVADMINRHEVLGAANSVSWSPAATAAAARIRRLPVSVVFEDGTAGYSSAGLWDACVASAALTRRPPPPPASRARRQLARQQPDSGDGSDGTATMTTTTAAAAASGDAANPRSPGWAAGNPRRGASRPGGTVTISLGDTYNSMPTLNSGGVMAGIHVDDSDSAVQEYLNYCEQRDIIRSTIVCRCHPSPE